MNLKLSSDTLSLVSDKTKFYAQPAAVLNLISELTESVSGFMNPKQKARFYVNAIIALNDKTVQLYPPLTVIGILIESATYDLSLSKSLQECYIIPYNNALQFIVGYKGWIKMFNRSGNVGTIADDVVYSGDNFESKMVNGIETISHDRKAKNTGVPLLSDNVTHSWVTIITKDDFLYAAFLTKAQILQRMDVANKKENKGAYAFYEPMFIKGCYKVMAKRFPLADEDKAIRDECTFLPTIKGNEISFDAVYDDLPQASAKALPESNDSEILEALKNCKTAAETNTLGKSFALPDKFKAAFLVQYNAQKEAEKPTDTEEQILELIANIKSGKEFKELNSKYNIKEESNIADAFICKYNDLTDKSATLDEWYSANPTLKQAENFVQQFKDCYSDDLRSYPQLFAKYTAFIQTLKNAE